MKKLLSILLTFVMVFSFVGMTASAAQTPETGKIIINNTGNGTKYKIYKMLNLAGYDNIQKAYRYTLLANTGNENEWYDFFMTGAGKAYVDIDADGNVTAKANFTESTANEFAQIALAYAKQHSLPANGEMNGNGGTIEFTGLSLGYYLVDSSMGALCGLTTTKPTGAITVKNSVPTIEMYVQEDSNVGTGTNEWGKSNSVDIGQNINYDITINAQAGAENYTFYNNMPTQFTFVNGEDENASTFDQADDGIIVKHHNPNTDITTILKAGVEYTVDNQVAINGGGLLKIVFNKTFCDTIKANDKIYISYSAKLLGGATIGADGNTNSCVVKFGDLAGDGNPIHETNTDSTTSYTYGVDIVKTDSNGNMLVGAEFELYTVEVEGTPLLFAHKAGSDVYRKYVELAADEDSTPTLVVNKNTAGNTIVRINGLDNGTYYLKETSWPDGYNPLTSRKAFTIAGNNILASYENTTGKYIMGSGVHIENKTGTTMPETGSMGTTAFVTFGSIVALATGVLLVTKKRMSMIDD